MTVTLEKFLEAWFVANTLWICLYVYIHTHIHKCIYTFYFLTIICVYVRVCACARASECEHVLPTCMDMCLFVCLVPVEVRRRHWMLWTIILLFDWLHDLWFLWCLIMCLYFLICLIVDRTKCKDIAIRRLVLLFFCLCFWYFVLVPWYFLLKDEYVGRLYSGSVIYMIRMWALKEVLTDSWSSHVKSVRPL